MYIISLTYVAPLGEVDAHLEEHVQFLIEQYAKGIFLASGRKVPRTGGIILARSASLEELEQVIALDPFKKNHVAEYEITEFLPTMTADGLEMIRE